MAKLNLETLKSHLWESANILRGSIDASDFKNYIFGMLILKRLSDVFDEELERLKKEIHVDLKDPDNYSFYVPERAHWSHLKTLTQNLGEAINKADDALEETNPEMLEGVLSAVDFNDKERLPDVLLFGWNLSYLPRKYHDPQNISFLFHVCEVHFPSILYIFEPDQQHPIPE